MTATKRQIRLDIVATDTECGDCEHGSEIAARCGVWPLKPRDRDQFLHRWLRLPQCIAAERGQGC